MKKSLYFLIAFLLLVPLGFVNAGTTKTGDTITIEEPVTDDLFVSGNSLTLKAPVSGELFAAGNTVSVVAKPERSAFLAGNTVTLDSGAAYNVFAAGSVVTLKGEIGHDVYAAGQTVKFDPSVHVKGSVYVAGASVELAGTIDGSVYASAENLTSNAVIAGDLKGDMSRVTFTGGSIGGTFAYNSNKDAIGLDKVTIKGTVTRSPLSDIRGNRSNMAVSGFLTMLVTGAALILLASKKLGDVTASVTKSWGRSFLVGLITLIVVPFLCAFILATIIGAPLALIAIALYVMAIYLSIALATIILGKLILGLAKQTNPNLWLSLIVGSIVLVLARFIPDAEVFVGLLFFLGLVLPTLGATTTWWREKVLPVMQ